MDLNDTWLIGWRSEIAVLVVAGAEWDPGRLDGGHILTLVFDVGDAYLDVDNRFGCQTGNGCGADMLDAGGGRA